MTLNDMQDVQAWLSDTTPTRTLCHGAMYQVEWHTSWKNNNRPQHVPADGFTSMLVNDMPVAVGTTSLDALLNYVHAHQDSELAKDIDAIGGLLRAQSDSVTGQQAGQDEVQNYNFSTVGGGVHYVLPVRQDPNAQPAQPPSDVDEANLLLLNEAQALVNSLERALQATRWDLFSRWWKFVTDVDNTHGDIVASYQTIRQTIWARYQAVDDFRSKSQNAVDNILTDFTHAQENPIRATLGEFSQARDPSVLVAGATPGWADDFLKSLISRLDYQIATFAQTDSLQQPGHALPKDTPFLDCIPAPLQATAKALMLYFRLFRAKMAIKRVHELAKYAKVLQTWL
jgi:hypothetical protein